MLMCPSSAPRIEAKVPSSGSAAVTVSRASGPTGGATRMVASAPTAAGGGSSSSIGSYRSKTVITNVRSDDSAARPPPTVLLSRLRTARNHSNSNDRNINPGSYRNTAMPNESVSGEFENPTTRQPTAVQSAVSNNPPKIASGNSSTSGTRDPPPPPPKFKLLQRPKLPRGHQPPPSQEAIDLISSNSSPADFVFSSSDGVVPGLVAPGSAEYADRRGAPSGRLSSHTFVPLISATLSDLDKGGSSSGSMATDERGPQHQHHVGGVNSNGECGIVLEPAESAVRKAKHVESMRSLRERERLYEEAKRRIWTSANRRGGLTINQPQLSPAPTPLDGPSYNGRECAGNSISRTVGDNSPTYGDDVLSPDGAGTTAMPRANMPQPPLYEYEPPYQPGTYFIGEDGFQASSHCHPCTHTNLNNYYYYPPAQVHNTAPTGLGSSIHSQTAEENDTRRFVAGRMSGRCGDHYVPTDFGDNSVDGGDMISAGGVGSTFPSTAAGGCDGRCCSFAACGPGGGHLTQDNNNNNTHSSGGEGGYVSTSAAECGCFCHHQLRPTTPAPHHVVVEPWELVRAKPSPQQQQRYAGGGNRSAIGRGGSDSTSHHNHQASSNGPPPLEDDFSFPPLGRTVVNPAAKANGLNLSDTGQRPAPPR